jgi:hypothetical protein
MSKKIGINLVDGNGNKGYKELDFLVYAPTPEITTSTGGVFTGTLDETLGTEPVSIYRYRN